MGNIWGDFRTYLLIINLIVAIWAWRDLFRNPLFGGGLRVLMAFVIAVPVVGVLIYLILRDAQPKRPGT